MAQTQKKVVVDFIKAFSCVYSITKNLSESFGVNHDPLLLSSVIGFSSGISTMGDTCGVANGGAMVLSKKYASLHSEKLYLLCSEYFTRLEKKLDTPDCGRIHGGKHLTKDFRRAMFKGKALKCVEILYQGTHILEGLSQMADQNDFSFIEPDKSACIEEAATYFEQEKFHCSCSVIQDITSKTNLPLEHIYNPAKGFIGGIGFNGTLCGAISGAVLCLGLANKVDLSRSGYFDTMKVIMHGLIKNDGIFEDENKFLAAKLFKQCKQVYHEVEKTYGHTHCSKILGLHLDQKEGVDQYKNEDKMDRCKNISKTVKETVHKLLLTPKSLSVIWEKSQSGF